MELHFRWHHVSLLWRCVLSWQSYFKFWLVTSALSGLQTLSWVAEQASFLQAAIHSFSQGPFLPRALMAGTSRAVWDWCAVFAVGWTLCSPHVNNRASTNLPLHAVDFLPRKQKNCEGIKNSCVVPHYFAFPSLLAQWYPTDAWSPLRL